MDELTAAVKRAVEVRANGEHDRADTALRCCIVRFTPNTPISLMDSVLGSIGRIGAEPDCFSRESADLMSDLSNVDYRIAGVRSWLVLSHILVQHGLLEVSGIARDRKSVV